MVCQHVRRSPQRKLALMRGGEKPCKLKLHFVSTRKRGSDAGNASSECFASAGARVYLHVCDLCTCTCVRTSVLVCDDIY